MALENFTVGWAETADAGNRLSQTSTTATFTGMVGNEVAILQIDKGASWKTGNFLMRFSAVITAASHENNSKVSLFILANTALTADITPEFYQSLRIRWTSDDTTNTNPILSLDAWASGNGTSTPSQTDSYKGTAIGIGTTFYCEFQRAAAVVTLKIYSDSGYTTLVDTLSITESAVSTLRYVAVGSTWWAGAATTISGSVSNFDPDYSGDTTPPTFSAGPSYNTVTATTYNVTGTSNESGTAKLIVTTPTASQPSNGTFDGSSETASITADTPFSIAHTD